MGASSLHAIKHLSTYSAPKNSLSNCPASVIPLFIDGHFCTVGKLQHVNNDFIFSVPVFLRLNARTCSTCQTNSCWHRPRETTTIPMFSHWAASYVLVFLMLELCSFSDEPSTKYGDELREQVSLRPMLTCDLPKYCCKNSNVLCNPSHLLDVHTPECDYVNYGDEVGITQRVSYPEWSTARLKNA